MFWVISPVALVSAFLFSLVGYGGLMSGDWVAGGIGIVLAGACLLLVLSLSGMESIWAARTLCGLVALSYAAYLIHEWGWNLGSLGEYEGRGQAHPINATLGFLVIGLPCASYAFMGGKASRHHEPSPCHRTPFGDSQGHEAFGKSGSERL